jgi:anti-sigma-K factor RskA
MDEQEFAELAAGAALNALSPADRAAFDAARREHPEWEHWVRADAATVASLADVVPDEAPLPDDDAPAGAAAPAPPADAPASGRATEPPPTTATIQAVSRRNWTRGIVALAASMVLLVALGLGAAMINDYLNRPPAVVALQEIEGAPDAQSATVDVVEGGSATAHWSESVGKAVLVSQGLPQIADDETYEMWFVRDGAAESAGTFDPEDLTTTALLDGAVESGDVIAITVEPQGGSPTGEPSSQPIVQIPTA